jgi:hypothetical protein
MLQRILLFISPGSWHDSLRAPATDDLEVLMTRTPVPPVLVTGATGRVGRVVVDLLIDAGVPVRGHAARRVGRHDGKAGVHHLYGVRHPRIRAAIVPPVGRRSRHRVHGRSITIERAFAAPRHLIKVTRGRRLQHR